MRNYNSAKSALIKSKAVLRENIELLQNEIKAARKDIEYIERCEKELTTAHARASAWGGLARAKIALVDIVKRGRMGFFGTDAMIDVCKEIGALDSDYKRDMQSKAA